jgi:hypothetical protein
MLGAVSVGAALVAATALPAHADTAIGVADDFFAQCDANVFVSDDLIGSDGKIEAWGGYSCPQSYKFTGQIKIILKDGSKRVGKPKAKGVNASTDFVGITVANKAGKQKWHADLWIFRPGFDATIVSTGVVQS